MAPPSHHWSHSGQGWQSTQDTVWFSKLLLIAITALNVSNGKWEGLLTQHVANPAVLTICSPFSLCYWMWEQKAQHCCSTWAGISPIKHELFFRLGSIRTWSHDHIASLWEKFLGAGMGMAASNQQLPQQVPLQSRKLQQKVSWGLRFSLNMTSQNVKLKKVANNKTQYLWTCIRAARSWAQNEGPVVYPVEGPGGHMILATEWQGAFWAHTPHGQPPCWSASQIHWPALFTRSGRRKSHSLGCSLKSNKAHELHPWGRADKWRIHSSCLLAHPWNKNKASWLHSWGWSCFSQLLGCPLNANYNGWLCVVVFFKKTKKNGSSAGEWSMWGNNRSNCDEVQMSLQLLFSGRGTSQWYILQVCPCKGITLEYHCGPRSQQSMLLLNHQ